MLVPEPLLLDVFFNKLLDARSIDIPVTSSLSKRDLSWVDAIAKGTRLLCRLENPDFLNDQSTVTSTDMLERSGWVSTHAYPDLSVNNDLQSFFDQEGIVNNPTDISHVRWLNDKVSRNSLGQTVPVCCAI